jgi:hypothetical protein
VSGGGGGSHPHFAVPPIRQRLQSLGGSPAIAYTTIVQRMKSVVLRLGSLALLTLGLYGVWTVAKGGQIIAFVAVILTAIVVIGAASKISEKRATRRTERLEKDSDPWWDRPLSDK